MASIDKHIRDLSAKWINPTYATMVSVPAQIHALIVHAFINHMQEGSDTELLREAYKRLPKDSKIVG